MTTAAAVAINARHCRWEMCGRKHFRFRQKYRSRPQASAGDRYTVLPSVASAVNLQVSTTYRKVAFASAEDAEYKRADMFTEASTLSTFMYMSANTCTCAQQCVSVNVSVCIHRNVLVCTSLLRCYAYNHFLSPANGGRREGRGEQLTVTPVPRTKWASAAVETWRVRAVSVKQWLQRPTNERVLLTDLHAKLRSLCHFRETGRLISSRV